MTEQFNVLISSAGRRVALLDIFRKTLRSMGFAGKVMAADMSPLSSAFHRADEAVLVPSCTDPMFVETMLEVCRKRAVRLLIPTLDPELPVYAANRQRFAQIGTTVAISSSEVVSIAYDKGLTHSWLVEHGFPTIRQSEAEVLRRNDGWSFPLLVKPRTGSSSIGVSIVRDRAELEVATRDGDFVVQTIAEGHEYTIDVMADGLGRCLCAVPRRRLEVRTGEVSKGMTLRSEKLIELGFGICDALPGAYGSLNIQVFSDPDTDRMNVIEINPRFSGGFPLSWQAGARYPQWLIEEILGRKSAAGPDGWQDGLVMLRWDEAVFTTADRVGLR
ncbi:MAG: ATP-grasp domain-containing protein [Actinomycetota bacterium]